MTTQEVSQPPPTLQSEPRPDVVHWSNATWARQVGFYLALFMLWEGVALSGIWPEYLFPTPIDVFLALLSGIRKGLFIQGALVSLSRIAIGYGISLFVGLPLGLILGRSRLLHDTVGSLVVGLQTLPSVCWLPLVVLWFGLNDQAIIAVVVLGALFSITIGVETGVRNTPPIYIHAAQTLGARHFALYYQVILPAALPTVLGGLKQGWAFAWRSLMAGELLYFTLSLGNLLQTGRDLNDAALVMAVMAMIIVIGTSVDRLVFHPLERHVRQRWGLDQ